MFWQKSYRLEWYLIIWHYLNLYVYSISFIARHFLLWKLTGAKFNFETMFQQERNLNLALPGWLGNGTAGCLDHTEAIGKQTLCASSHNILIRNSKHGIFPPQKQTSCAEWNTIDNIKSGIPSQGESWPRHLTQMTEKWMGSLISSSITCIWSVKGIRENRSMY